MTRAELDARLGRALAVGVADQRREKAEQSLLLVALTELNRLRESSDRSVLTDIGALVTEEVDLAERFRLWTAEDLRGRTRPRELVEDWLVGRGLNVLFGASQVGKSFLAPDWSLSLTVGIPWLGHRVDKGRVLYVLAEDDPFWIDRVDAWCQDHGGPDISEIRFIAEPVNLYRASSLHEFISRDAA